MCRHIDVTYSHVQSWLFCACNFHHSYYIIIYYTHIILLQGISFLGCMAVWWLTSLHDHGKKLCVSLSKNFDKRCLNLMFRRSILAVKINFTEISHFGHGNWQHSICTKNARGFLHFPSMKFWKIGFRILRKTTISNIGVTKCRGIRCKTWFH